MMSSSSLLQHTVGAAALLSLLFLCCMPTNAQENATAAASSTTTTTTTYPPIRYNEIRQKDSHNSYERLEGLLDQMIYHHLRTVEIDSHLGFTEDLYSVYHDAGYFQSYSSFNRLRDGIKLLQEFHDMFPNHHVVTIFMDLKGGFGELHTPQGFDNIISSRLPLWTPADAQGDANTIKEGIDQNGWPDIEELRGKFIWVLTSGAEGKYCSNNDECVQRSAFLADYKVPTPEDVGRKPWAIFYNQQAENYIHVGPAVQEAGYVGRVYYSSDINTPEKWESAEINKYHHITTDRINYHRDPFTVVHNAYGYPFQTTNGVDVSQFTPFDEGGRIMYMYAPPYGGDAWGRRDSIHYVYRRENYTEDMLNYQINGYTYDSVSDTYTGDWIEYTTSISLSNSHCDQFAKAGIMLREVVMHQDRFPLGSGKYFAVVRTCRELMRVQYRERPFMLTVAERLRPTLLDGIEQAKRLGIKLRYRYDGQDSYCEGYFKLEGRDPDKEDSYILITKLKFPDTQLTLHGLFTSSHYWKGNQDGTPFKALFINSKRNGNPIDASDFDVSAGFDNPAAFGDGYFPDPVKFPDVNFEEEEED